VTPGGQTNPVHPAPTRRSGYRYLFSDKHHGGGAKSDSRWLPDLIRDEEFSIFDAADWHELSDDRGWLYGILRSNEGQVRYLGTWGQQVAAFPFARPGAPWHGYPLGPVKTDLAPPNHRGDDVKPSMEVFLKMERAGLISGRQRKRLQKGRHT
jgi:hypothetical protein